MKIKHLERLDYSYAVKVAELLVCRRTHHGIHVDRIERLYIRVLLHHAPDSTEHMVHRLTEIFAAVSCDKDKP